MRRKKLAPKPLDDGLVNYNGVLVSPREAHRLAQFAMRDFDSLDLHIKERLWNIHNLPILHCYYSPVKERSLGKGEVVGLIPTSSTTNMEKKPSGIWGLFAKQIGAVALGIKTSLFRIEAPKNINR